MTAAMRDMDFSGMGKPSMLRFNLHRYGLPRTTRSRCSAPSSASTTSAQPATGRPSSSSNDTPRLTPSGFSTTLSYRAERWRKAIENPGHARATGHPRPDRRVRVLAAVLAHARRVAFAVARIERRGVERRRAAHDQTIGRTDEVLVHGGHGALRAIGNACARQHAP